MNAELPKTDENGMFTDEHGDVFFRICVDPVAQAIADHFSDNSIFASKDLDSMEPIFEGIELSVSDKEIIAGRIRKEVCNAVATAVSEHVVC